MKLRFSHALCLTWACAGWLTSLAASGPFGGAAPALSGAAALRRLREQGSEESLRTAVRTARYRVRHTRAGQASRAPDTWTSYSPAQRLAARFTPGGVELTHFEQPGQPGYAARAGRNARGFVRRLRVRVSATAVGRGTRRETLVHGTPRAKDNRVEFLHHTNTGGRVAEWYLNEPTGLEHGFVLSNPPAGRRTPARPVVVVLRARGDLESCVAADGSQATLRDADGVAVLAYAGLKAWDARGRPLSARIRAGHNSQELELAVADAGAAYPLTIDPTWSQQARLTASDRGVGDHLGSAIAIDGNTVVVGAHDDNVGANVDQGSAYVFTRTGVTWTQQAHVFASDGAAGDQMGISVAVKGDTAVVGANRAKIGANTAQGAAYVFTRSGVTWTQQQKLVAADGATNDQYGISVAVSGNTAAVGAYMANGPAGSPSQSNWGAVYVWLRSGVTWSLQQKLTAADANSGDRLGISVALDSNTLAAGAYQDNAPTVDQGSVYIFVRSGVTWSQQQQLLAPDPLNSDQFGWSVALQNNTVVVGADLADVSGNVDQGAAYVFTRSGSTWSEQQKLVASDGAAGDNFGWSVGVDGNLAVVGADLATVGGNAGEGAAYVYARSGSAWSEQQKLAGSPAAAGDHFGTGVAISGITSVVGAELSNGGVGTSGSAYVFLQSAPVISSVAAATVGKTSVTVTWTTDVAASSTVEYGLTTSFGSTAAGADGTSHTVSITGLTAGRTYSFRVRSTTLGGTSASESLSPASGAATFVTAPDVGVLTVGFSMRRLAGTLFVTVTFNNTGVTPETGVLLDAATLRGTSTATPSTSLPVNLGTIAASGSASTTLQFSGGLGVAGAAGVLNLGWESSTGTGAVGYRTTLP